MRPTSGGEGITHYDVHLGTEARNSNDTSNDNDAKTIENGLSLTEALFPIEDVPPGPLTLFLQVRILCMCLFSSSVCPAVCVCVRARACYMV